MLQCSTTEEVLIDKSDILSLFEVQCEMQGNRSLYFRYLPTIKI
jgi:hypothetical protein